MNVYDILYNFHVIIWMTWIFVMYNFYDIILMTWIFMIYCTTFIILMTRIFVMFNCHVIISMKWFFMIYWTTFIISMTWFLWYTAELSFYKVKDVNFYDVLNSVHVINDMNFYDVQYENWFVQISCFGALHRFYEVPESLQYELSFYFTSMSKLVWN